MNSEYAVQRNSVPVAAPSQPDMPNLKGIKNIMLLLALIQKDTLDGNGKSQKFYAQQRADGIWLEEFTKKLGASVTAAGQTATLYIGVEAIIEQYTEQHKGSHLDSFQILALHALKYTCAKLKDLDVIIEKLVEIVEKDTKKRDSAQRTVDHDKKEIHDLKHKLKHASWKDYLKGRPIKWAAELANYERKLNVGWGPAGESDNTRLAKAQNTLNNDNIALGAKETQQGQVFAAGVVSQKNEAEGMRSMSQYQLTQSENVTKEILSSAGSTFAPLRA